jgi:pyruvate dehydrogenase E1 component beta subunit
VGAPFAPIPLSPPLEDAWLPGADDIVEAVRALLISPSATP